MLLAIDIGNTNIVIGIFKGKRLLTHWRLPTHGYKTVNAYLRAIKGLFKKAEIKRENIEGVIICSVVPKVLIVIKKVIVNLFQLKPLVLGENIIAPIKNLYRNPKQVGQDRLVNAVSTYKSYGGPVIAVDFGTAITFDLVSKQGAYLGGIIVPGLEISLDALTYRTALLPKRIKLDKPKAFLGKDTLTSMKSGIFYGFGALCDGIVDKLKRRFVKKPLVVATGGHAKVIARYCKTINKVNPHLTLEGLRIIYRESK